MNHLLLLVFVFVFACGPKKNSNYVLEPNRFEQQLQSTAHAVLVDVRKPDELAAGQIAGARNVVYGSPTFEEDILQLEKKPVFIYCAAGVRSGKAARFLRDHGYEVYELEGGLNRWMSAGLPVVTP